MGNGDMQAFYFHNFGSSYMIHILKEIYWDRLYEPYLSGRENQVILDIGANIGLASYYFKDYAKRVIAVEPSALHAACIREMISFNKITNIELCQAAISPKSGTGTLYHNGNLTMFSLNSSVNDHNITENVQMKTLEELVHDMNVDEVDLLKLDVEGTEGDIVRSDGFKKIAERVRCIIGEWHHWSGISKDDFRDAVIEAGFHFNWYSNTEASIFQALRA